MWVCMCVYMWVCMCVYMWVCQVGVYMWVCQVGVSGVWVVRGLLWSGKGSVKIAGLHLYGPSNV